MDESVKIKNSEVGDSQIRERVTVHDSTIGDGCRIYENVSIKKSSISDKVDINSNSYLEKVRVEDNVQIGPNASIVGVTHNLGSDGMEFRNDNFKEIILREGAFIGAGAVVLPGIEIGRYAVIAANSTVTRDVEPKTLWKGTPEHSTRSLD